MGKAISRPQAEKKKIHYKNQFELCYLRHQYFRKTKENPTLEEMKPFMAISENIAKNTFYVYRNLFHMVGFDCEDIISIANVHLISFLGLFTLDKMPEKYDDFVKIYTYNHHHSPNESATLDKNKANYTVFLKQRMEDMVRICRQKARNIKGLPTEEHFFYCGTRKPPLILRDLLDNCEKLGYKKIGTAIYKSIKKKSGANQGSIFRFNNMYYVAVAISSKTLSIHDLNGADLNPNDNIHNMTPEQICSMVEENNRFESKKKDFNIQPKEDRIRAIQNFIQQNKKNPLYLEEIKSAKKMLHGLVKHA